MLRGMLSISARFEWKPDDPEIVSDVLFAVANVLSIARTTYLMPAFEVLGPLQISLGRMIGDITRFLVLFTLVSASCSSRVEHIMFASYGSASCTYAHSQEKLTKKIVPMTFYKIRAIFYNIIIHSVKLDISKSW